LHNKDKKNSKRRTRRAGRDLQNGLATILPGFGTGYKNGTGGADGKITAASHGSIPASVIGPSSITTTERGPAGPEKLKKKAEDKEERTVLGGRVGSLNRLCRLCDGEEVTEHT